MSSAKFSRTLLAWWISHSKCTQVQTFGFFFGKGMHQITWDRKGIIECFNCISFSGEGKHAKLFLSCKNKFQLIWWPRYSTVSRLRRSMIVIYGEMGNIRDGVARLSTLSPYVSSRLIEFVEADRMFWHFHWLHWSLQNLQVTGPKWTNYWAIQYVCFLIMLFACCDLIIEIEMLVFGQFRGIAISW